MLTGVLGEISFPFQSPFLMISRSILSGDKLRDARENGQKPQRLLKPLQPGV